MQINRRTMVKGIGGGLALAGSQLLLPSTAFAKPGGHLYADHYCSGNFNIAGIGQVPITFNGTGYASFNNVSDYDNFRMSDIRASRTVSMNWEVNQCFGLIGDQLMSATALVVGRSPYGSTNVLLAEGGRNRGGLYPATMVNMLHFLIEVPGLGLKMINKDPMVLRGSVHEMSLKDITADPRYKFNPNASLPRLGESVRGSFNPVGVHRLSRPVEFVDAGDMTTVKATLIDTTIESMPSYGIAIVMTRGETRGSQVFVDYEVKNLTAKDQDVIVYLDDSRALNFVQGKGYRRMMLPAHGMTRVLGIAEYRGAGRVGHSSCLFCGVNGLGRSKLDVVSGFHYSDGSNYNPA